VKETGFVTAVNGQAFSAAHVLAHSQMASSVSLSIDPVALAQRLAQCADTTPACATNLTAQLGRRLFRRSMLAEEQMRFAALFTEVAAFPGSTFTHAARALLNAMLQAPQFQYKQEQETLGTPGEVRMTTGHELVSRLSYFLWQSAPDDTLLAYADRIAAAGGVIDPTALADQVLGMMQDTSKLARAREIFWSDYSHASSAAFQDAEPGQADELRESVKAAFGRISGDGGPEVPLKDIFTTTQMVMTPGVAKLAGLQPLAEGLQVYDTSSAPQRIGLLTHPGFLAAIGSTSFVGRGTFLSERVLCRVIVPPPVAAIEQAINDTATTTKDLTPKGASEYRLGLGGACQGCHLTFEPISYAFERFDVLGDYREKDLQGRELSTFGFLQDAGGNELGKYQGIGELMALLAASDEVSKCFALNMLEFASGHSPDGILPAIDAVHADFIQGGGTYSELVQAVALSPSMRALKVAASE
jgi:hypothetical protein